MAFLHGTAGYKLIFGDFQRAGKCAPEGTTDADHARSACRVDMTGFSREMKERMPRCATSSLFRRSIAFLSSHARSLRMRRDRHIGRYFTAAELIRPFLTFFCHMRTRYSARFSSLLMISRLISD